MKKVSTQVNPKTRSLEVVCFFFFQSNNNNKQNIKATTITSPDNPGIETSITFYSHDFASDTAFQSSVRILSPSICSTQLQKEM